MKVPEPSRVIDAGLNEVFPTDEVMFIVSLLDNTFPSASLRVMVTVDGVDPSAGAGVLLIVDFSCFGGLPAKI